MPRRNAALSLVAVATLGLATGCEKQSPIVTVVADGVVVKAHAAEYCREDEKDNECNRSDEAPVIEISTGDTLGVDVPRSVAEDGWSAPTLFGEQAVFHDHYKAFTVPQIDQGRDIDLIITSHPEKGSGVWRFKLRLT